MIARRLAAELTGVRSVRLAEKGRGRALRAAWEASDADVLAYCDVDLSTDLAALLPLVAPLISGHSDLAIGTRLGRGARVVRGSGREFVSRAYNLILRGTLAARFTDARRAFAHPPLAEIRDQLGRAPLTGGGFTGSDPDPTLAQFQQLVADGEVRWYLPGRGGGPGGGGGPAAEIDTWAQAIFTPVTVGGTTVDDLAAPVG